MKRPASFPGRPGGMVRFVRLAGLLVAIAILAGAALAAMHLRTSTLMTAQANLAALDTLLAEQSDRALQSVELVVNGVAEDLRDGRLQNAEEFNDRATAPEVFGMLVARISGIPQLDAVTVIARDGRLLNFSRYQPVPPVNVADRDYFRVLSTDPSRLTFVGLPVENRGNGSPTIYLARRISSAEGQFLGLVLGAMNLHYFERLYADLQMPKDTGIALWRDDGALLLRHPPLPAGMRSPELVMGMQPGERRVMELSSLMDGRHRIVAATRLQTQPVVISISRTTQAVLARWRIDAGILIASAVLIAVALLLIASFVAGRFRLYARMAEAMAAREAAERGRRSAEEQLRQAQKLEALGQLAGGVAHDFNNVLQAIAGGANLIRRRAGDPQAVAKLAGMMGEAAERGAAVTRRLLAFARKDELRSESVAVEALLADLMEILRHTLGPGLRILVEAEPGLPVLRADRSQLEAVLINLATNARDAMPEGGTLRFAASRAPEGEGPPLLAAPRGGDGNGVGQAPAPAPAAVSYLRLAVSDTGNGMDAETLSRATEPFFTTKPKGQGTGLGLSMAKGFAEQSGGALLIASTPGRGTVVTLWLPLPVREEAAADPPHAAPAAQARAMPAALAPGNGPGGHGTGVGGKRSVLLVEDEAALRELLSDALAESGFRVGTAGSGAEALVSPALPRAELLVTDLAMPGMNGLELARRARLRRPGLGVLLVTGFAGEAAEDDLAEARAGGPFAILRKPVTVEQIAAAITGLLAAQPETAP
ncbi:response regulator [Roseomonas gilardii]|uniref:histidine kinase n=1 Tax=Roseomonas gilardii TaxID=257708 RepID=A0ABU3MEE4_9PROT|nr:ATP-binding protein [Roseomonas gilardii]MDT8330821.1 response regulator [Roseomonas gilardii]